MADEESGDSPPPAGEPLDSAGSQIERTALSWVRTLLSTAGCALFLTRLGAETNPVLLALGVAIAASAALVGLMVHRVHVGQRQILRGGGLGDAAEKVFDQSRVPVLTWLLIMALGAATLVLTVLDLRRGF